MEPFHGTTILSVRRLPPQGWQVALGGDGQVTLGNIVVKSTARKVRKLHRDQVLAGFAGATAADFAPLDAAVAGCDEFDIDAHNLVRIDAGSARLLLDVLTRLHAAGKKLRIIGLSTLLAVYLETLGFADGAELRARAI